MLKLLSVIFICLFTSCNQIHETQNIPNVYQNFLRGEWVPDYEREFETIQFTTDSIAIINNSVTMNYVASNGLLHFTKKDSFFLEFTLFFTPIDSNNIHLSWIHGNGFQHASYWSRAVNNNPVLEGCNFSRRKSSNQK